ncbi:hypothetical protein [Shimia sp. R9_3]|uniref:hypothetical protein n=1 Tax=Shimia sp. R9_3 TaxID=2821113 RepID=UPI001ADB2579|nr:hypothetical protein [Shimia sp. R9_3]MBO9400444.1 hypothetical protein [Shimia sp. R9_3]
MVKKALHPQRLFCFFWGGSELDWRARGLKALCNHMKGQMQVNKETTEIELEHALRAHDRNDSMIADSRKAAIESANIAIRSILLVNGGAVVALLAFIGTIESGNSEAVNAIEFVAALRLFSYGVGFAATTAALAYLINMLDTDLLSDTRYTWKNPFVEAQPSQKWLLRVRTTLHLLALLLAVLTLISFFSGVSAISGAVLDLGI